MTSVSPFSLDAKLHLLGKRLKPADPKRRDLEIDISKVLTQYQIFPPHLKERLEVPEGMEESFSDLIQKHTPNKTPEGAKGLKEPSQSEVPEMGRKESSRPTSKKRRMKPREGRRLRMEQMRLRRSLRSSRNDCPARSKRSLLNPKPLRTSQRRRKGRRKKKKLIQQKHQSSMLQH